MAMTDMLLAQPKNLSEIEKKLSKKRIRHIREINKVNT
jgi:hypothetical protein